MKSKEENNMIIGIDHGYGCIKTTNCVFTTGLTKYEQEPYTTENVIRYEDKYYVCGSGRQVLIRNKTQNDNYYILTLCALAKELKFRNAGNKTNIIIAAGLPLTSYGRDKDIFMKYLKRYIMQPVKFDFENEPYKVFIDDVTLYPQGCAAVIGNMGVLATEPSVIVCDIGSWTVDTFRMDNGTPNADTCRSLEMGIIRMMDRILEDVRSQTGLSITAAQIERVMKNQPCIIDEKAKEIIERQGEIYIDRLLRTLVESGFDITAIPTIYMGGGATLVERNIDFSQYAKTVFVKDIKANATAYERLAKLFLGDVP
jgi:plasmid segregation protein ParM